MSKVVLGDVASGFGVTTVVNTNNDLIEAGFDNSLSRNGAVPNQMQANLDMGGKRVINLGAPVNPTDGVRLRDVIDMIAAAGL